MALALDCDARSEVGRRANNEDAVFASSRVAAVADGVGGAVAGEVASWAIIHAIIHLDKCRLQGSLSRAVAHAIGWGNQTIGFIAECRPEHAGMSTTLTAVALGDDETFVIANIGDSRTYLLRDGALTQLTHRSTGKLSGILSPDGRYVYYLDDEQGNEIGHYVRVPFAGVGFATSSDPALRTPAARLSKPPGTTWARRAQRRRDDQRIGKHTAPCARANQRRASARRCGHGARKPLGDAGRIGVVQLMDPLELILALLVGARHAAHGATEHVR